MNWLDYKDYNDFLNKTGLTPKEAREYLLTECKTRGLL
jgi:hypothetical protein